MPRPEAKATRPSPSHKALPMTRILLLLTPLFLMACETSTTNRAAPAAEPAATSPAARSGAATPTTR